MILWLVRHVALTALAERLLQFPLLFTNVWTSERSYLPYNTESLEDEVSGPKTVVSASRVHPLKVMVVLALAKIGNII